MPRGISAVALFAEAAAVAALAWDSGEMSMLRQARHILARALRFATDTVENARRARNVQALIDNGPSRSVNLPDFRPHPPPLTPLPARDYQVLHDAGIIRGGPGSVRGNYPMEGIEG